MRRKTARRTFFRPRLEQLEDRTLLTVYNVGPGQAYTTIGAVPWNNLQAGDQVDIHWQSTPYHEKILLSASGTASQPIQIIGVPGPQGQLPVIDGNNATTSPNAPYFSYTPLQDDGVVIIGRDSNQPYGYIPSYITIQGLQIQGADGGNSYTAENGSTRTYGTFTAGIWVELGANITIQNCTLTNNGLGLFVLSKNNAVQDTSSNILVQYNSIYGNGVVGNYLEHNIYTEADGVTIQYNYMGPLRAGAAGSNIKDRSAGTVIRYNYIQDGGHLLDLVDAEDDPTILTAQSDYYTTYVYGNVLISDANGPTLLIHYGGDSGSTSEYRNGTLYFYNNTLINEHDQSSQWRTTVFEMDGTSAQQVDAFNNIFYNTSVTPGATPSYLEFSGSQGNINFGVNWVSPGWLSSESQELSQSYTGTIAGTNNFVVDPNNNPGFTNLATFDAHLANGSSLAVGKGGPLVSGAASYPVNDQYVYQAGGQSRPNINDLGAFAYNGAKVYAVTSTADSGAGTLRDAINQVNAGKYNTIDFNIGAVGSAQTINLASALPAVTVGGITINGLSQGGANNTTPLIQLNGASAGSGSDGLLLDGANCTVSGLIVEGFSKNGIEVAGSNNLIGGTAPGAGNVLLKNSSDGLLIDSAASGVQVQGNDIGINQAGTAQGNARGIEVAGTNNTLGGTLAAAHNVISGNTDGIVIDQNASGNAVLGNFIGTDATAHSTTGLGNSDDGIKVLSASNTIGGAASGLGNVIDGSGNDGIYLGSSAAGVLIERNYIGVDNTAQSGVLANGNGIEDAGNNNTIGVSNGVSGNVISGNKKDGILLDSTANHELIQGNLIGVGATLGAVANSGNGIEIQGVNNTVGGTTAAARNYIGSNSGDGVLLSGNGNVLQGNYIGTTQHGQNNLGNGSNGVEIASSGNVIGGSVSGASNVIAGNKGDGVRFDNGGSGNTVQGNYVGCINYTSTQALANSNGIEDAGGGNLIGGTAGSAPNFISGNSNDGVLIDSGVSGDVVEGNHIGTNAPGTSAVANSIGVVVQGSGNTIGGSVAGAANFISGNKSDGVLLNGSGSGNVVEGDYIGLKNDGQGALSNSGNGIEVAQSGATLGGTVSRAHNYIGSNSGDGVLIDSGGNNAVLEGNYIGLNVVGAAVANSNGVVVNSNNDLIGGSSAARNYISGNSKDGVFISASASGVMVQSNYIGLSAGGSSALGNSIGVEVAGSNNTVGGTVNGARNVISGNSQDGILLDGMVSGTAVQGNYIGTDSSGTKAVANGAYGVAIAGGNNVVGGSVAAAANVIAFNAQGGVFVSTGSGDTIRRNSIFANGPGNTGPGIVLASGVNNNLAAPTLNSATLVGTTLTVTGTFTAPTANVSYVLEFFANPLGDPEGKIYLGSETVQPASTGTVSFTFTTTTTVTGTDPVITATLTDATGDTSTFSSGVTTV